MGEERTGIFNINEVSLEGNPNTRAVLLVVWREINTQLESWVRTVGDAISVGKLCSRLCVDLHNGR